jgi:hypothetical protein
LWAFSSQGKNLQQRLKKRPKEQNLPRLLHSQYHFVLCVVLSQAIGQINGGHCLDKEQQDFRSHC